MDTSELNIKMCEQAKKYLPKSEWEDGDWYLPAPNRRIDGSIVKSMVDVYCARCEDEFGEADKKDWTKLYRQDQLQEMIEYADEPAWHKIEVTNSWCQKQSLTDQFNRYSMEQLWLVYVMFELYHKVWNGTDWI